MKKKTKKIIVEVTRAYTSSEEIEITEEELAILKGSNNKKRWKILDSILDKTWKENPDLDQTDTLIYTDDGDELYNSG